MCEMHPLYSTEKETSGHHINTSQKKKIHGSQGSTHMFNSKHVWIVRSLYRENSYFRVKIGHLFKVKFTCHRGKPILNVALGVAGFSMTTCPLLLIHKNSFLKIAVGFAFSVYDLFYQFILAPHLPLRNRRHSVFSVPKVCLAHHRVFNGVFCNREEYIIQAIGSNPSL